MIDVQTASKLRNRLTCVIVRSQVAQRQLDGQIGDCVLTSLVEAEAAGWETLGPSAEGSRGWKSMRGLERDRGRKEKGECGE